MDTAFSDVLMSIALSLKLTCLEINSNMTVPIELSQTKDFL